jgi:hypothetical protein
LRQRAAHGGELNIVKPTSDAHFGVYRQQTSRNTGSVTTEFQGLVPPEHKNPGTLYESYQVAKLRKWAPVRTYYGNLGENGERGDRWRLMLRLLTRHGVKDEEAFRSQPFSLILTISDPLRTAPVYDEMARTSIESLSGRKSRRARYFTHWREKLTLISLVSARPLPPKSVRKKCEPCPVNFAIPILGSPLPAATPALEPSRR